MPSGKILQGKRVEYSLDNTSLGQFLFDSADRFTEKICQIDATTDQSETYSSVKQRSVRVAIELQKRGITSKDVAAFCSYNSLDNAIPVIASFYLGAKVVNLDPTLSARNTAYLLELVSPTIVFVDDSSLKLIEESLSKAQLKSEVVVLGQSDRYVTLADLSRPSQNEAEFKPSKVNVHDIALMFFSSGTTGLPKAICHSHYTFLRLTEIAEKCGVHESRVLHFTTFYWISGMMMLITSFLRGGTRIFARSMEGENVFRIIEKYKVQSLFMAPIYTYNLTNVKNPERFDTSSLKNILTGGTSVSTMQLKRLDELFENADIIFGYGMTEVGMVSVFNPETDKDFIKTKIGSCGKPSPGNLLKVVNPDTEEILGPNQKGEIRIKSPGLMLGYYLQDSSECFDDDGYLKTGDIGYYDEAECFYVVERIKEMFKYQSWHIVPSSIEAVLVEHPAIKEAIVFGIPRGEEGEVPAACVVLKEGFEVNEKDIKKFVEDRVSDKEKLRGGVVFLEELPKTPSGKFRRKEIKEIAIKLM